MRDDQTLVRDMKRGDTTALAQVYERYKNDMLTAATCLLTDRAAAEDCMHDVVVAFAAGISRFRLRASLRGFLVTCVANRARDILRKRNREPATPLPPPDSSPPATGGDPPTVIAGREKQEQLQAALAQLPYEQREVITLHLHGELTFREVARQQDVSPNTAQSRYRYGIDKLRTLLRSDETISQPATGAPQRREK